MIKIIKGEKRNIPMLVVRHKKLEFEIDRVNCRVVDNNGDFVETGLGIVEDKEIYYFLDSTQDHFIISRNYVVCFEVTIVGSPEVIKGQIEIKIVNRRR